MFFEAYVSVDAHWYSRDPNWLMSTPLQCRSWHTEAHALQDRGGVWSSSINLVPGCKL